MAAVRGAVRQKNPKLVLCTISVCPLDACPLGIKDEKDNNKFVNFYSTFSPIFSDMSLSEYRKINFIHN